MEETSNDHKRSLEHLDSEDTFQNTRDSKRARQDSDDESIASDESSSVGSVASFADDYDSDLMGDDDDREKLEAMPELEREAELARRHDARVKGREHVEMMRQIKANRERAQQAKQKNLRTPRKRTKRAAAAAAEAATRAELGVDNENSTTLAKKSSRRDRHGEEGLFDDESSDEEGETFFHKENDGEDENDDDVQSDTHEDKESEDDEQDQAVYGGRKLRKRQTQRGFESDEDSSEEEGEWTKTAKLKHKARERAMKGALRRRLKTGSRRHARRDGEDDAWGGYDSNDENIYEEEDYADHSGEETDEELLEPEERQKRRKQHELMNRELTASDVRMISITRPTLVRYVSEPFFHEMVRGLFVRVFIGMNKEDEPTYRMARINRVVRGERGYTVEHDDVKTTVKRRLEVTIPGASSKVFKVIEVSSRRPTPQEFTLWKELHERARKSSKHDKNDTLPEVTPLWCKQKFDEVSIFAKRHVYKDEEIERMCGAHLGNLQVKDLPFLSNLKERMNSELTAFREQLRIEYGESWEEKLNEITSQLGKRQQNTQSIHLADLSKTEVERLAQVARQLQKLQNRIRDIDEEEERRASLRSYSLLQPSRLNRLNEQRNKEQTKRVLAKEAKDQMNAAVQASKDANPFLRRSCIPRILWKLNKGEGVEDNETVSETTNATAESTTNSTTQGTKLSRGLAVNNIHPSVLANEADAVLAEICGTTRKTPKSAPQVSPAPRRGLSLADYQQLRKK